VNQATYRLTITEGIGSGQVFQLTKGQITVGRDENVDIVIQMPAVSRRQAQITWRDNRYWIEDLGSANGTFINGNRLLYNAVALTDGDFIQFGQSVTLLFEGIALQQDATRIGHDSVARAAETIADAKIPLVTSSPPELIVTIAGNPEQRYPLTSHTITIGRAEDNDIVIQSQIVSRHHARLERVGDQYQLTTQPEATNPVYLDGYPLSGPQFLRHNNILRIGGYDPGLLVTLEYRAPSEVGATIDARIIEFCQLDTLNLGRDSANEIVLDAPNISRFHAQIERVGQRYRVRDLRSANGTFVNNQLVDEEAWLSSGDSIKIGPYRFILGPDQLSQIDDSGGLEVSAFGLKKWVRKDLNILQNISLIFKPREFIVVVGQSGGGKSTLVDAIAGYRPATDGQVFVNGIDVYKNFDAIRNDIGFVPQRDIIHMELTVYQALDYAARLRMPKDTSKDERHQRILEVLDDLDLAHRKDVQISGLSGGQQKRVSIGVELLTKPGLFFLDEPTSGLDPGTETALMQLMRRLADQGRTIVLVTHATKNVMLADKVIFLARGGHLAWFGPPDEALEYFNQHRSERARRSGRMEFDEIYAILDDPNIGSPEAWGARYQQHRAYQQYIVQPLQQAHQDIAQRPPAREIKKEARKSSRQRISSLRQFFILSSRNIKILVRDRTSLVLMLLAAPLVGALDLVIAPLMGDTPFDYFIGDMSTVSVSFFLLVIYALLVGGLSQMREFVKEADVYKRERLVNLKIFPYVASKAWVAALLALYQALTYTLIRNIAFDIPGGLEEFLFMYITLVLATLAGMMLGLLASALAPASSSAPLIMILLIVPQIVLSGALAPLPNAASAPASTRWSFEALMAITGAGSDVDADPCWKLEPELREAMTIDEKDSFGCRCMGTNVFDPAFCTFPGLGQYYHPSVVAEEPQEPEPIGDPPPEPVVPEAPEPPEDQSDQIAVSSYLVALQDYQDEVNRIQDQYKAEVDDYQARADVYKAEVTTYQTELAEWGIDRMSAISGAEGLIENMNEEFGWTFVNKEDLLYYYQRIVTTWVAQGILILVMFGITLFLIKRKDAK
jgi:ABC-type multidrug transport system ATPase subunit/pSer/pThr/pTyr-binding forkhead associated (FHA) protein